MNKKRGISSGITFLLVLLMVFVVFWVTGQAQQRSREITSKEYEKNTEFRRN